MAIVFRNSTSAQNKTSSTTVALAGGVTNLLGSTLFVWVVFDNLTATTPTVTGISKNASETANWVKIGSFDSPQSAAAGGVRGELWRLDTTASLNHAYTVTLSAAVTAKTMLWLEFGGVGALSGTVTSNNTGATISKTVVPGQLFLPFNGTENNAVAPLSGFTASPNNGTTGGSAVTNVWAGASYRIVVGGGTEQTSSTLTDGGLLVAVFDPSGPVTHQVSGTVAVTTAVSGAATKYDPIAALRYSHRGWWDFSNASSVVLSGGNVIDTVIDQSSQGNDLNRTGSPILGSINGRIAADFSGGSYLSRSFVSNVGRPCTVWAVVQADSTTGVATPVGHWPGAIQISASNQWAITSDTTVESGIVADNGTHVILGVFDGASSKIYVDGVLANTGVTLYQNIIHFYLGRNQTGGENFDGRIGEAGVYAGALSAVDQTLLMTYLREKWGVASALPIAAYGFNEGSGTIAHDDSWHQRHLTPHNGNNPEWVAGHTGGGVFVPAPGDAYWEFAYDPPGGLRTPDGAWTMMSWAGGGIGAGVAAQIFYGTPVGGGGPTYAVYEFPQSLGVNLNFNTANMQVFGHDAWQDGKVTSPGGWAHLAVTWDGVSVLRLYANGVLIQQYTSGHVLPPTYAQGLTRIGLLSAYVDDYRLFEVALTPAEIVTWMNTPIPVLPPPPTQTGWGTEWGSAWPPEPVAAVTHQVSGTVAVNTAASGTISKRSPVSGTVPVVVGATGTISRRQSVSGTVPVVVGTAGTIRAILSTAGTVPVVVGVTGGATRVPQNFQVSGTVAVVTTATGDATGVSASQQYQVSGTVAVVTNATGDATRVPLTLQASGTVPVVTNATGAATRVPIVHQVSGTVAVVTTATGAVTQKLLVSGTIPVVTTASGSPTIIGGAQQYPVSGTVAVVTTAAGTIGSQSLAVSGTAAVVTSASGNATRVPVTFQVSGTVAVQTAVSGTVTAKLPVSGTVPVTVNAVGAITSQQSVSGTVAVVTNASGSAFPPGGTQGTVVVTTGVSGSVTSKQGVSGTPVAVTVGVSGTVSARKPTAGIVPVTVGVSGTVSQVQQVSGTVAVVTGATGDATRVGIVQQVSGTVAVTTTVTGNATSTQAPQVYQVSGTVAVTTTVTGIITKRSPVSGTVAVITTAVGTVSTRMQISGTVPVTTTAVGTISVRYGVSGTVVVLTTVTGFIFIPTPPPLPCDGLTMVPSGPFLPLGAYGPNLTLQMEVDRLPLAGTTEGYSVTKTAERLTLEGVC